MNIRNRKRRQKGAGVLLPAFLVVLLLLFHGDSPAAAEKSDAATFALG